MRRFFWVFGIFLLIATLAGASWYLNQNGGVFANGNGKAPRDPAPLPRRIICMGLTDIEGGVIKMYPVRTGEVIKVVAAGAAVDKGAALLELDSTQAEIKVKMAKADLDNALELEKQAKLKPQQHQYQIEQLDAKYEAANRVLNAAQEDLAQKKEKAKTAGLNFNFKLQDETIEAQKEELKALDAKRKELKLVVPESFVRQAAADVAAKRGQLAEANYGLLKCKMLAPEDGTVLQVFVNANEVLGSNPTAPALTFAGKTRKKIVRAEVIQEWANFVKVGQEAIIEDDTFRGPLWKGAVKKISHAFNQKRPLQEPFMMNDQRILECIIEINSDEDTSNLRISQRVRVSIVPTAK